MASFSYDGTWLGGDDYKLHVIGASTHTGLADTKKATQDFGGRDGEHAYSPRLKRKLHTMECVIHADTARDWAQQYDRIRAVLDPRNGVKLLVMDRWRGYGNGLSRGCYAMLHGPIHDHYYGHVGKLQLFWLVPDGKDVTVDGAGALLTTGQTGATIETIYEPAQASGTVWGTDYALPTWTLTASGASTGDIVISNVTTGETFTWEGSLADGHKLRINVETEYVDRWTGAAWSTTMRYLTSAAQWPRLAPAVRNQILIAGLSGTVDIAYHGRFL